MDNAWLTTGFMQMQSAYIIMQAQDAVTNTKEYLKRTRCKGNNTKCRMCKTKIEILNHILVGCPIHQFELYKDKHDAVCKVLWHAACIGIFKPNPKTAKREQFQ